MQVLSTTARGLVQAQSKVYSTTSSNDSWLPFHLPGVFNRNKDFSPIAANGDGHVYVIGRAHGYVREFRAKADAETWALVGNVTSL
jgi:hypothetical protein